MKLIIVLLIAVFFFSGCSYMDQTLLGVKADVVNALHELTLSIEVTNEEIEEPIDVTE